MTIGRIKFFPAHVIALGLLRGPRRLLLAKEGGGYNTRPPIGLTNPTYGATMFVSQITR